MAPKRNYTPQQMGKAIEAVGRGTSVAAAAKQYGVPRITLRNKVTGKSPIVSKMGPKTILTEHEEEVLVKWLIKLNERHFPVGKQVLLDSVQKIMVEQKRENPFNENRPGKKWFHSFMKRHPEISERTAQNLTSQRDNVTEENIKGWFEEIDAYLQNENLKEILTDPRRIFNADESAFFLNPKPGRVLAKKGETHIYSQSGDEKENLTVLVCANAAGQQAPPMIVYDYERIPSYISNKVPEEWGIGRSDSGWMCSSTFYEYVANILNPWIEKENIPKPVLFFLDGHASHVTMHLSNFGLQNGIEIIALYPNSTHILQPMDIAVFKPLKTYWKNEVKQWKMENLGQNMDKENFAPVLKRALTKISKDCIKNGFRSSGLFPFGPDLVDMTKIKYRDKIDAAKEDSNQKLFMAYLESGIVKIFTLDKLNLFNNLYYQDANTMQDLLPNEDLSLYMIWAKNRQPQSSSQTIQNISCAATGSTMSKDAQENEALSPTTSSVPQGPEQSPTQPTDIPESAPSPTTTSVPQELEQSLTQPADRHAVPEEPEQSLTQPTDRHAVPQEPQQSLTQPTDRHAVPQEPEQSLTQPTDRHAVPQEPQQSLTQPTDRHAVPQEPEQSLTQPTDRHAVPKEPELSLTQPLDRHAVPQEPEQSLTQPADRHAVPQEPEQSLTQPADRHAVPEEPEQSLTQPTDRHAVPQEPEQSLTQPTDRPESAFKATYIGPQPTPSPAPGLFDRSAQYNTPSKVQLNEALGINVPTPFKRNLFWPDNEQKKKKRRKREKIPSAVTSKAWRQYHEKKEEEKRRLQEEKENRAKQREEKKRLKEKMMAAKKKKASVKGKKKIVIEDSSSEDTDCEIAYAESDESDWIEFQRQMLTVNENSGSENETLNSVSSRKKPLDIRKGNYVIVKYEGEYFPGRVENTDVDTFDISTMVLSTGNTFRWPERPDKIWYRKVDIVEKISDPVQHNKRGFYKIKEMHKYLPDVYTT